MSPERRRHPRLHVPVDGTWDGLSGRADARIVDISLDGCFVDGRGAPAVGERLKIELRFPGALPLPLLGEVIYVDRVQGFAMRFVEPSAVDLARLAQCLVDSGLTDAWGSEG